MAKSAALTRLRVVSNVAHTNRVRASYTEKIKIKAVTFNVHPNAPQCCCTRYIIIIYCRYRFRARCPYRAHGATAFRFRWKLFYGLSVPTRPLIGVYELLYTHRNHVVGLDVVTILLKHTHTQYTHVSVLQIPVFW